MWLKPSWLAYAITLALATCGVVPAMADNSAYPIKPIVSHATEASHVFCTASCMLRSLYVTTGATAGYLMTFNRTTNPADGAVTELTPAFLKECIYAPANSTTSIDNITTSDPYITGMVAVFSSTGCFTKTESATAFFKGQVE